MAQKGDLSAHASGEAYRRYAVHESRNVLRDAMGKAGHIDLSRPHAPLLFIAGDKDEVIPDKLNKKNADHYTDDDSLTDFKEFSDRGHFICGQPDWEEVADYAAEWSQRAVLAKETVMGSAGQQEPGPQQ